jgi:hypothetical protein
MLIASPSAPPATEEFGAAGCKLSSAGSRFMYRLNPRPRKPATTNKAPATISPCGYSISESTSFPLRPQPELDQALMAPSAEPVGHRNTATTVGSGPDSVAQCHFLRNPRSRKYSVNSFSTKDVRDR